MSEFAGFDLDRSTARAWSKFQARLADHVAGMEDDDVLLIEAESSGDAEVADGSSPYVQFCAWGADLVRCEVSSNEYLAADHVIDPESVSKLQGLGWATPTHGRDDEPDEGSANFYLDLERNHADRLAVMTVRALRDVFGVAHPVFLSSGNLKEDDEPAPDLGVPSSASSPEVDPDEPLAVTPSGPDHLRSLVDDALLPVFGHPPQHDEDGDVPVVSGSGVVWVRVLEDVPAVQIFATIVSDIADRDRAAFEVAVLNRDLRFLQFVLLADRVMAHLYLPAYPFAPRHLRGMLSWMSETVDQIDDDLAARVGGRRAFERAADEDDEQEVTSMHPAIQTLLQLDAESPDSVDPELAANICEMDRDLILELISWNNAQEIAWRQSRDEAILLGDPDGESVVADGEMQQAERTTNLLRRALRVVVEAQANRGTSSGAYGGQGLRDE